MTPDAVYDQLGHVVGLPPWVVNRNGRIYPWTPGIFDSESDGTLWARSLLRVRPQQTLQFDYHVSFDSAVWIEAIETGDVDLITIDSISELEPDACAPLEASLAQCQDG